MSTTITGTGDNYPTNITIPSDGDARSAASVNVANQALADRTQYLFEGKAGTLPIELGYPLDNNNSRFTWMADSLALRWEQTDVAGVGRLQWWLRLPIVQSAVADYVVTGVTVNVNGSGGTAGANAHLALGLPVTLPQIILYTRQGATITTLGTQTDPSVTQAAYDDEHPISITGLSQALSTTRIFILDFQGETGGGVANALVIRDAALTLART